MQRAAMMARGQVGGTGDREGGGCQQGLRQCAAAQFLQGAIQNLVAGCFFYELDQGFDGVWVSDSLVHWTLLYQQRLYIMVRTMDFVAHMVLCGGGPTCDLPRPAVARL